MAKTQDTADLLDLWEELRESGATVPFDHFAQKYCEEVDEADLDRLRDKIQALQEFDARIEAARLTNSGDTSQGVTTNGGGNSSTTDAPPTSVPNGYSLISKLGSGGFGEVWKAKGAGGFTVALKFVALETKSSGAELESLKLLKKIRHPNLLNTVAAWILDRQLVIASELAGRTLADRLKECQQAGQVGIPKRELIEYMTDAAKALDFLNKPRHKVDGDKRGSIQHRDIKPQNLLMSGGGVKVADLGVARLMHGASTSYSGGMTVAFAPPEFFQGRMTAKSDQFSLAMTYCVLRGGRLPNRGSKYDLMAGKTVAPDVEMLPEDERAVVARALSTKPEARWPRCRVFIEALAKPAPEPASPISLIEVQTETPVPDRHWNALLIWSLSIGVLLGAVAVYWIYKDFEQRAELLAKEQGHGKTTEPVESEPRLVPNVQPLDPLEPAAENAATPETEEKTATPARPTKPSPDVVTPEPAMPIHWTPPIAASEYGEGFRDIPGDGSFLVGFEVSTGRYGVDYIHKSIASMRPIYRTPSGEVTNGIRYGFEGLAVETIVARPGYAVGSVKLTFSSPRLIGLQILFMRLNDEKLDATDTYSSPPYLRYNDSNAVKVGKSELIVGVAGRYAKQSIRDLQLAVHASASGEVNERPPVSNVPRLIREFRGHTEQIRSIAVSADGELALSGGVDHVIRVWDIQTATEKAFLRGHTAVVNTVGFIPNSNLAFSGGGDASLRIWDITTGRQIQYFKTLNDCRDVTMSADGRLFLCGIRSAQAAVQFFDRLQKREVRRIRVGAPVFSVELSPDESTVAIGRTDGLIELHNIKTKKVQGIRLPANGEFPTCIRFTPNGESLLVFGLRGVTHWKLNERKLLNSWDYKDNSGSIAVAKSGGFFISSGHPARVYRLPSAELAYSFGMASRVAFLPGDEAVLASFYNKFELWQLPSAEVSNDNVRPIRKQPGGVDNDASNVRQNRVNEKGFTNSIGMKLVLIQPGEFMMGSPASEKDRRDEELQHRVRITKPYYLATTEVTQKQWQAVMGITPWMGEKYVKAGPDFAASYVSWEEAQEYCRKLSAKEGLTYRLPTEAEWEYACRAGSQGMYGFGNSVTGLKDYAWFHENAKDVGEKYAHEVGRRRPNAYGLYDMHGNVWEWCSDRYAEDYYKNSPASDPAGPSTGQDRVYRGGCWGVTAWYCRSAGRRRMPPDYRDFSMGFRVAAVRAVE